MSSRFFLLFLLLSLYPSPPAPAADAPPTFTQTNLVSDLPGIAAVTDGSLLNPWGLAVGLNGELWIAVTGSGQASAYAGAGQATPSLVPFAPVTLTSPAGGLSSPTGIVTNGTSGFRVSAGRGTLPATQVFATEDGTIVAWSSRINQGRAMVVVDNSGSGATYKGLALGFNGKGAYLFATNFRAGTIDVFDSSFQPVRLDGEFQDDTIPPGYAPFGIAAINGSLFVTYALQDDAKVDDVAGPGLGFVNVFDTDGNFVKRFASGGELNAPWGLAWAPLEGFGGFRNAILVGNFGDGQINALDFETGELLGKVMDADGKVISIPGLWALGFGLGIAGGSSTLYFTAGPGNEEHGLLGYLRVNPSSLPAPGEPEMLDSSLEVTSVVRGLEQPTGIAFLGPGDFFVIEKASGRVKRVTNGVAKTVLRLPVNSASERGLLGIALQPGFRFTRGVYLYWTETRSGAASSDIADVPALGNRVDRYEWDWPSETLAWDRTLIRLRSYQADEGQPLRGNHDGGKIAFGPDGKLYVQIGDQGRRGQLQNLPLGASNSEFEFMRFDDLFGGPVPGDAHLTGVILRLEPDGSTPADNPFAGLTTADLERVELSKGMFLSPNHLEEAVRNLRKVYSYGRRNSFGMAFDPVAGHLWQSENGDDTYDEMNRVTAGSNGGWVQLMGPSDRVGEFRRIESSFTPMQGNLPVGPSSPFDPATFLPALQQVRWSPTNIAVAADLALTQLFEIPGSRYEEPQFSWRWAVAPAGIGFAGAGLGSDHAGNLYVGASRTPLEGGYLFEFRLDGPRTGFAFSDERLFDLVDDNEYKFDLGESESLVAGRNFGIVTDILTGPDGNLYVTSLTKGAVFMISR